MTNATHIISLCAEIEQLEQRMKQVTISNQYAVTHECEILLGEKYNELMNWVDFFHVEKIENGRITLRP